MDGRRIPSDRQVCLIFVRLSLNKSSLLTLNHVFFVIWEYCCCEWRNIPRFISDELPITDLPSKRIGD